MTSDEWIEQFEVEFLHGVPVKLPAEAKSELLKAIMESLPKENHSCLTHKHIQCAGCAISGVRAKLRELFGE